MWSDQGGEDGSFDGNEGRSEDSFIFLNVDRDENNGAGVEDEEDEGEESEEEEEEEEEDFGWIVEDADVEDEVLEGEGGDALVNDVEASTVDAGLGAGLAERPKENRMEGEE